MQKIASRLNLISIPCIECGAPQLMTPDQKICVQCRDRAIDLANERMLRSNQDFWRALEPIVRAAKEL